MGYLILNRKDGRWFTHFDSRMRPHFDITKVFPHVYFSLNSVRNAVHKICLYLGDDACDLEIVEEMNPNSVYGKYNGIKESPKGAKK